MLAGLLLTLTLAHADDASAFTCCDDPVVERVVKAWLDAGEALHDGKPHAAALQRLAKAAEGRAAAEDRDALKVIAREAKALAPLPLASVRVRLQPLAQNVLWLALRHDGGTIEVVQATCAGQGSWLQQDTKKVRNPSGATCGHLR
jgi:hypothetical protein